MRLSIGERAIGTARLCELLEAFVLPASVTARAMREGAASTTPNTSRWRTKSGRWVWGIPGLGPAFVTDGGKLERRRARSRIAAARRSSRP